MVSYPGYTVERIREELSWRQIEKLLIEARSKPTIVDRLQRLETIAGAGFGVKLREPEQKPLAGKRLVSELERMGWL